MLDQCLIFFFPMCTLIKIHNFVDLISIKQRKKYFFPTSEFFFTYIKSYNHAVFTKLSQHKAFGITPTSQDPQHLSSRWMFTPIPS